MRNNKHIGNEFERQICYRLSEWLTGKKDELVLWRSASSGAVNTTALKRNVKFNESGDLRCTVPEYKYFLDTFHVDTKSMKEVNFFITKNNFKSNALYQEWIKTVSDATINNKIPLMIVKVRTKRIQFLVLPTSLNFYCQSLISFRDRKESQKNSVASNNFTWIDTEEFFELNDPIKFFEKNRPVPECLSE